MILEEKNLALGALVLKLSEENQALRNSQSLFQDALFQEISRIEATPKAWRWMQYGKLLLSLIDTIKTAIETYKKQTK